MVKVRRRRGKLTQYSWAQCYAVERVKDNGNGPFSSAPYYKPDAILIFNMKGGHSSEHIEPRLDHLSPTWTDNAHLVLLPLSENH